MTFLRNILHTHLLCSYPQDKAWQKKTKISYIAVSYLKELSSSVMLNFKSEFLCHRILYSHLWQNSTSFCTDTSASSQYDSTTCVITEPLKRRISSPKVWLESFLKQSRIPLKLETSAQPLSEADRLISTKITINKNVYSWEQEYTFCNFIMNNIS